MARAAREQLLALTLLGALLLGWPEAGAQNPPGTPAARAPQTPPVNTRVQRRLPPGAADVRVMPNVKGMNRQEWSRALEPLYVQVIPEERFSCEAKPGLAWGQDPPENTILTRGAQVRVIYAPEVRRAVVPVLRDHAQEEVERLLAEQRLCVGSQATQEGEGVEGQVIGQRPEAGAVVPSGSRVNFVVRVAPPPQGDPERRVRPGWVLPVVGVGAGLLVLIGAAVLLVRPARPQRPQLPKEVRLSGQRSPPVASSCKPEGRLVQGEVDLRPVRDEGQHSTLIESGHLVQREEKVS